MTGFWPPADGAISAVLERLHAQSRREMPRLHLHYLPKLPNLLLGRKLDWSAGQLAFYDDKLIALSREQGELLHLLAQASRARTVVELGTGFGVGAIYLAAAMRATGGRYVGTELSALKAEAARRNLADAGLASVAEVREGDGLVTLAADPPGSVDLLVLDGWPPAALPTLRLLEPRMPRGALLVADNVRTFRADLASLVAHVRQGAWRSMTLPQKEGTLLAVRQ